MASRGRRWGSILVLAFLIVPILEIYVIVQVGQVIGAWWTIVLLVADSIAGTWLVRREGGRAWRALRTALEKGRMPATEIADGALILIGGTLMVTPGFVTDIAAALLIIPVTRPIFRRMLARVVASRLTVVGPGGPFQPPNATRPGPSEKVVRGEVVDD